MFLLIDDVLVVGKNLIDPPSKAIQYLFGTVSFANCPKRMGDHTSPRYRCVTGEPEMFGEVRARHSRCLLYEPDRFCHGVLTERAANHSFLTESISNSTQHRAIPDLRYNRIGWLSTGAATVLHWLDASPGWTYVYGFSHVKCGETPGSPPIVVDPPVGMPRADGTGRPGRHPPDVERKGLLAAVETGRMALHSSPQKK